MQQLHLLGASISHVVQHYNTCGATLHQLALGPDLHNTFPSLTMPRPIGPKGVKSAGLSLRLTPRTRYGLALLARVNRRSLGQVVEEALEMAFYGDGPGTLERRIGQSSERVRVLDVTWDERPWVRLGKLALMGPELLTTPERRLWDTINQTPSYWHEGRAITNPDKLATWMAHDAIEPDWDRLSREAEVGI